MEIKLYFLFSLLIVVQGKQHCSYNHHHYDLGSTWVSSDGCNTCTCTLHGTDCTTKPCPTLVSTKQCSYNNQMYTIGKTWTASDGCNLCSCTDTGVHCTNHQCQIPTTCTYHGNVHSIGSSFDDIDGCNTCMCMEHGIACTEMACVTPTATKVVRSSVYQLGFNCRYNGKQFNVGETWTAMDGCNTCSCHRGDLVVHMTCTENHCGKVSDGQCLYDGKSYNAGDSFPSTDKCNTCGCGGDGLVFCTERACLLVNNGQTPVKKEIRSSVYQIGFNCHYNGKQFNVGETWPAADGCNTCSCHAGDLVVRMTCTESPCGRNGQCLYHGKSYKSGDSFPSIDKCNTCNCGDNGAVACTEMACLFNQVEQLPRPEVSKRSRVYQHGRQCHYNNRLFNVGETWPATDGCNTCSCHAGDILVRMICTEKDCTTAGQCMYHGTYYKTGDSFPSIDKCNTCFCSSTGHIGCTEKFCLLNNN